ncbi:uncharacterized protein LOC111044765 [Nilaparvata lugens]|uniref:uncharacterized protein LOC111044765 n=1 Tax=Nilaparvata lugens TaxID=108931 RepID=UPI00193CA33D|nr:uncharacterized protein LOC111044765 [Nilaparvata lugens]
MGSNGSKFVKKIVSPFNHGDGGNTSSKSNSSSSVSGPIVLSRQGSMYFDEDGDLAHEFYIEELPSEKGSKARMRRITTNLRPQQYNDAAALSTGELLRRAVTPFPGRLKIAHVNAQSLLCHIDEFRHVFGGQDCDVVLVSESWLKPDVSNRLVELDGERCCIRSHACVPTFR